MTQTKLDSKFFNLFHWFYKLIVPRKNCLKEAIQNHSSGAHELIYDISTIIIPPLSLQIFLQKGFLKYKINL